MKGTLASLLLVTLQLAQAAKPHFFSNSQYFSNADGVGKVLPGRGLSTQTFKIYFDTQVTGFETTDISISMEACTNVYGLAEDDCVATTEAAPTITSASTNNDQQWSFQLTAASSTVVPAENYYRVTMSTIDGACQAVGSLSNCQASSYVFYYSNGLSFTSATEMVQQTVSFDLDFTAATYNLNGDYFPFYVTVNGAEAAFGTYTMDFGTPQVSAKYFGAEPNDQICLKISAEIGDALPAFSDHFGNYYSRETFEGVCYTVTSDTCAVYTWSEWSDCTFQCKPDTRLDSQNKQYRDKIFTSDSCETEKAQRVCAVTYTRACVTPVVSAMETGLECAPADGSTADTCTRDKQTLNGCECGNGCELKTPSTCCQSYYKNCLDNAASNPALFYKYLPCWEPHTCVAKDTLPEANTRPPPASAAFGPPASCGTTESPSDCTSPYCDSFYTANPQTEFYHSVYYGAFKLPVLVNPISGNTCDPLTTQYGDRAYNYECSCFGTTNTGFTCLNAENCCSGFQSFNDNCISSF